MAEWRRGTLVGVAGVVIALDQLTKLLVVRALGIYDSVTIIPRVLDFTYVRNTGLAYGVLNESAVPYKPLITGALAIAALAGIGLYAWQLKPHERWARLGMALILGGAIGNLIDRARLGYVVDFVDVYWRSWHFWAFNVADAAISVGAVCVFVDLLLAPKGTRNDASRTV